MIICLADAWQLSYLHNYLLKHNLESYFKIVRCGESQGNEFMKRSRGDSKDISLFLDSGAFSAFTKNVKIDINDYINFIKKYKKYFDVYANLDVIGDPEATLKNQNIMENAGLNPLPCFHYGEEIDYLKIYLDKYDYIALGGMVPISTNDLSVWLDDLFSNYIPYKKKIHGFGLTSHKLMFRYPWYSVDSTSWVIASRMGNIYVPKMRGGKYNYLEDAWKVTVSAQSTNRVEAGQHIESFSPRQKEEIMKYLEYKGFELGENDGDKVIKAGLCNDYKLRDEINIIYFLDLEKHFPEWPWKFEKKYTGFFLE